MSYGVLFDGFWSGPTGREIASIGGSTAQLVALYLMGNQDANMIGLYPLRLPVARERIATLSARALERAVAAVELAGFARYDTATEYVWVIEMARYRLQLQDGKPLGDDDRRRIGAAKMFANAKPNPFLKPFHAKYRVNLQLPRPKAFKGQAIPIQYPFDSHTRSGVSSQRSVITEQGTGKSQDDQEQRADAPPSHAVLVKLAHTVLDGIQQEGIDPGEHETIERIKDLAAKGEMTYDTGHILPALDSARAQRRARRAS